MELESKPSSSSSASMSVCWQWSPTKRHLLPGDSLFEEGDIFCNLLSKQIPIEKQDEFISKIPEFTCGLAGCKKLFNNLLSYECHYNSLHRNLCATCHRVFPSSYLLGLHIQEWHDAMFEVMSDKKPMFCCLLESCGEKFLNCQERKEHMIKEHKYPANFRFDKQKKLKKSSTSSDANNLAKPFPSSETTIKPRFSYKIPQDICFGQMAVRSFQNCRQAKPQKGSKKKASKKREEKMEDQDETTTTSTTTDIEQIDINILLRTLEDCH